MLQVDTHKSRSRIFQCWNFTSHSLIQLTYITSSGGRERAKEKNWPNTFPLPTLPLLWERYRYRTSHLTDFMFTRDSIVVEDLRSRRSHIGLRHRFGLLHWHFFWRYFVLVLATKCLCEHDVLFRGLMSNYCCSRLSTMSICG